MATDRIDDEKYHVACDFGSFESAQLGSGDFIQLVTEVSLSVKLGSIPKQTFQLTQVFIRDTVVCRVVARQRTPYHDVSVRLNSRNIERFIIKENTTPLPAF